MSEGTGRTLPRACGKIIGVGRALGSRVVTNADLEKSLDTTDEWIRSRTGILERRLTAGDEDVVSLSVAASKAAIEDAGIPPQTIDLIVCATSTNPESMPSVAALVGEAVGAVGVGAMDLSAACAGYAYAAAVASSLMQSGLAERVLLIGADAMSHIVDERDRSTAIIFADGAGAVVLDLGDGESGFVDHILGANGALADWGRAGHPGDGNYLYQNGRGIFRFAVEMFPKLVEEICAKNKVSLEDVQYVIPHQANQRIIQAAGRKLDLPAERVVMNLDRYGNTSAGSIPLSYPDLVGSFERGRYVVTVGFGFGLTWAANLYRI
ncbi:fabH: 3-oxoacyl-[acyl-carrier-protein] synthase III [Rubrobacter radiotolerans]|uniref:Beta-ketoacyl-[acyl-carrier-protein] synthase III n=1 Tax=Rubrobacter radiotolerans TaxID=42256 RepID=A0A023X2I6_RUBRA|nr:beta-ketoacyl-ACP synthase 3 [Rubrobacter radiotolerans]AHY46667.1 fabH: 3-oxoacyl-[acyl-carrier-protein] synthase III [Rubrobacter radiotolerans]MDX5894074.1 beta-ketoacyl-ACP synthase 3 [Rubrobacter radiotolerans]SMC05123.1 3-oxoacyl-[acyl-carrier-protein] synthase-3 [Rubrobacter radiotolerans DSM 5868]